MGFGARGGLRQGVCDLGFLRPGHLGEIPGRRRSGLLGTLEGLKSTWIAANQVAKELEQIKDYAIYSHQFGAADEFDLVLMVEMDSTEDLAPNRKRYDEFLEAYGQANIDKAKEKVLDLYNRIRRIKSTYLLRKIDVK